MNFVGTARKLAPSGITVIAGYLGCEVAALKAVIAVESAGNGFAPDKRPIILNEPHIFYRELGKVSAAKRTEAVKAGLAYARWKTKPYPKTQALRYAWLGKAMAISKDAALKACSWGLGQIMGFNYKLCGYASVTAFVEAMKVSEGAQLYAIARFIVSAKLQRHIRNKAWAAFAKGYNGSGHAKHGYHTKMANAYAKRPKSERVVPPVPTAAEIRAVSGQTTPVVAAAKETAKTGAVGGVAAGATKVATEQAGWAMPWLEIVLIGVAVGAAYLAWRHRDRLKVLIEKAGDEAQALIDKVRGKEKPKPAPKPKPKKKVKKK